MTGAVAGRARVGRAVASATAVVLLAGLLAVFGPELASGGRGGVAKAGAQPTTTSTATNSAYGLIDAAGGIMTFGGAGYQGDTLALTLQQPVVGGAADPAGGYWMVAADGGIFSFGNAGFYGSMGGQPLNKPIVGMAATPDGGGYWMVASDGGIFNFGNASFYGSMGGQPLNKPIVGMAATPDGGGYWLVAADGGIFSYGDAQFWGSTGSIRLNKPIVGMAATNNGGGYWMVASDGGIFDYGDAGFFGSTGNLTLNEPVVGMAPTPDGSGYWLLASDAGVFTFGDAAYSGSAQSPEHPPLYPPQLSAPIAPEVAIINDVPGPQAAHQGELRVAFSGDSLSQYEGYYVAKSMPPYLIEDGAESGCGYTNGAPTIPWDHPLSDIYLSPTACTLWYEQLQWVVSRFHPDVTVIQTGYWECQDRQFDGGYATLADPAYAAYIQSNLTEAVQIAHSDGGAVILSTSPYFDDGTPNSLVDDYNQIVETVASENPYVSIDDIYSVLDPNGQYATVVDGIVARSADGVHITQAGVENLIEPALNQIIANVADAVYAGSS